MSFSAAYDRQRAIHVAAIIFTRIRSFFVSMRTHTQSPSAAAAIDCLRIVLSALFDARAPLLVPLPLPPVASVTSAAVVASPPASQVESAQSSPASFLSAASSSAEPIVALGAAITAAAAATSISAVDHIMRLLPIQAAFARSSLMTPYPPRRLPSLSGTLLPADELQSISPIITNDCDKTTRLHKQNANMIWVEYQPYLSGFPKFILK